MYNDKDVFMSPPSSNGSMNYHPSLNNKFKKRMMKKPIHIERKRNSKISQIAQSSNRNDSSDSANKIPSIGKSLKSVSSRNSKMNRMLKNASKGSSTSRGRHLHNNQSANMMPQLK